MNDSTNIKQKNLLIQMIWSYFGKISSVLLSYIVSIILARLLSPNDYGLVSIANIFLTLFNVIVVGGFDSALIYKKEVEEKDYNSVFSITIIVSIFLYLIVFFVAPYISQIYNEPTITNILRILGLVLIINSFQTVLTAKLIKNIDFKSNSIISFIGSIVAAICGILLAYNNYGPWALVANQLLLSLCKLVLSLLFIKEKPKFLIDVSRIKPLFKYGWKLFLTTAIGVLYENLGPLIISAKYTKADLAFYDKGRNTAFFIGSTFVSSISDVLFPTLCKVQDDVKAIKELTKKYLKTISFIIYPMLLGFFAISDNYIKIILTEKWLSLSFYIKSFCVVNLFGIFIGANINASKAIGKSDVVLKGELVKKTFYSIILVLVLFFAKTPKVLAFGMILITFTEGFVNASYNNKIIGYGFLSQLKDVLPNMIISLIMAIFVTFIETLFINKLVALVIQIFSGIAIYTILCIITKNESFYFIIKTIKTIKTNN